MFMSVMSVLRRLISTVYVRATQKARYICQLIKIFNQCNNALINVMRSTYCLNEYNLQTFDLNSTNAVMHKNNISAWLFSRSAVNKKT